MASVNLQKGKCNRSKALYGVPKHNYRTGKNHSNKDIDPTRSHLNKHYGPQTAEEFRERLRSMIEAADQRHPPKRKKQDRQVMLCADIPSPREGMSPEQEAEWSKAAYEVMCELFPGQVVGGSYHADEIHEYTDPHDHQKHMSRGHTHIELIPWTEEKGLNMDAFYKRDLPNRINKALDKACQELFGFPYRDGTQQKSKGTVERMKLESTIAEREMVEYKRDQAQLQYDYLEDQIKDKDQELEDKDKKLQETQEALEKTKKEITALEQQNEALRTDNDAKDQALKDKDKLLLAKDQEIERKNKELSSLGKAIAAMKSEFREWKEKLHGEILAVFKSLNHVRRKVNSSPWLSKDYGDRILDRADEIAERTEQAVEKPLESAQDYVDAYGKVRTERGKAADLEQEVKDAIEDGMDR